MNSDPTVNDFIILSDGVIREEGTGKLTIIGCFQFFNAPSFPFTCAPFIITASITNLSGNISNARLVVRIQKLGHVNASSEVAFSTKRELDRNESLELPFAMPPVLFHEAGIYEVVVLFNGEEIGKRTLIVRSTTATIQNVGGE